MKEIYEKIYIKSESDLPKDDNMYVVKIKDNDKLYVFEAYIVRSYGTGIDWYLQPISDTELIVPDSDEISERARLEVSHYLKARNNPSEDLYKRLTGMSKWAISEIKKLNK